MLTRNLRALFLALLIAATGPVLAAQATLPDVRINVGGTAFTDAAGKVWEADRGFTGGTAFTSTAPIANTTNDSLYQSQRYGVFSYAVPVPNGEYVVLLHWAEHYEANFGVGRRVFRANIEGTLSGNIDIFAAVGGNASWVTKSIVNITDGIFTLNLVEGVQSPSLAAIELLDNAEPPPSCWPRQTTGTGSLAYWDTNDTGFAVVWYCPPAVTTGSWTPEGFVGNWAEVPGGMAAAIKTGWTLLWGSYDGNRAGLWSANVKKFTPGQDYTSVNAMNTALRALRDPQHIPSPRPPVTTAPACYNIFKQVNRVVMVPVCTIPVPFACDPKQQINGFMAVPTSAVTWTGSSRPKVVYASCAFESP